MSLILDALNRSDSERANPDAAPGLQTVHGTPGGQGLPLWRRALWPALAVVLAIVAAMPWLGERDQAVTGSARPGSARSGSAGPGSAPPAVSVNTPAQPAAAADPPAPEPPAPVPAVAQTPPVVAVPQNTAPEQAVSADVAALYETRAVDPVAPADPRDSASSTEMQAAAQAEPAPGALAEDHPPLDVDTLARAAEAALEERSSYAEPVVEHEAPFIVELSQPVKDQIPSIFYSAHNWASNPSQRSVILNGQERRVGQQVKPGLKLVDILEDSIVLDFRGTEFRLRSLNSWVNL